MISTIPKCPARCPTPKTWKRSSAWLSCANRFTKTKAGVTLICAAPTVSSRAIWKKTKMRPTRLALRFRETFLSLSDGETAFRVSARLDRIILRPDTPDTLVVRDYKIVASSLRPLEPIQVFINLCVAKLVYQSAYKKLLLELVNLTDDGTETTTYRSADLKGMHRHVAALVQRHVTATDHPATPSEYCQFCPLLDECRDGFPVSASLSDIAFDE